MRHAIHPTCVAIIAAMYFMAASPRSEAADLPYPKTVADHFIAITMGDHDNAKVVKWREPPTIRVETFDAEYRDGALEPTRTRVATSLSHHAAARQVADELSELTGMSIRVLPPEMEEGGHITITLMPLRLMAQVTLPGVSPSLLRRLRGPGRCFFVGWPSFDGGIAKGHVFINSKLEENHIKHCLYEEITQSLGAPHDSRELGESIFNDGYLGAQFGPLDEHLIQILYDPRMPIGAGREEARAIAELVSGQIRSE